MSFLKGSDGKPLVVYRGERASADDNYIRTRIRSIYFEGDKETASIVASPFGIRNLDFDAPRVFPVQLRMKRLFINQPDNPMLELSTLVHLLGSAEARRIALRFSFEIEKTDGWNYHINAEKRFKSVTDYLKDPEARVEPLYFDAFKFFASNAEVGRIARVGYDGAIHGGRGFGIDDKPQYVAFSKSQIHYILSSGVGDDDEEYTLRRA